MCKPNITFKPRFFQKKPLTLILSSLFLFPLSLDSSPNLPTTSLQSIPPLASSRFSAAIDPNFSPVGALDAFLGFASRICFSQHGIW
ncbi:hypothetical protein JHK82_020021 [Glycine max]|uniref:Uncharacterized protein n=1 Tax=Glycine max TaxID=3847 RepID=K7L462_SOYBN|nr:hypothetical protein JHK85_020471 [Glycine max]KAG5024129.1 hypothetical protein JHK86_020043 [Glycine max]KAG5135290.1 hypothetical protein JHK82_020021 [Glycine max]KAH1048841.1 hypothetical protein GYH30_019767 [Glycine max]KRH40932.1 hypothetical protein GLYMA_08G000200v4 [Glycine max]